MAYPVVDFSDDSVSLSDIDDRWRPHIVDADDRTSQKTIWICICPCDVPIVVDSGSEGDKGLRKHNDYQSYLHIASWENVTRKK